jgi:hypothetical protein
MPQEMHVLSIPVLKSIRRISIIDKVFTNADKLIDKSETYLSVGIFFVTEFYDVAHKVY